MILGNNYKGSGYYGAYPPGYLKRIMALFPDMAPKETLHLFSGSLKGGLRVDRNIQNGPTVVADATALPFKPYFRLVVADPPYGSSHARKYGFPMVNRRLVLSSVASITMPGGHLVWLDVMPPMFKKLDWHWWGALAIVRSTNHQVRLVTILERR